MKKYVSMVMAAVLVLSVTACGGSTQAPSPPSQSNAPAAGGEINIKMATGGQDTLPSYASVLDVINDIEAADSNVSFEYYGARQLGDDAEILQQVMAGTIQMGGTAASAFSTYTPLLDAFTIPFMLNDYDKERKAMLSEEAQAIFDAIEEDLGVKILASYDSGMRHLANNVRPIKSLEDMKGLKLRVVPSDVLINSFTAMGANPTSMAYGEIYTGLQNKVIDGEEINITSIYSEKHYEVIKYFTEIGIYPFATTIIANAQWFNSLDQATQDTLVEGFKNGYNYVFDKHLVAAEQAGYDAMIEAGVEIEKIEDVTPFKEAVKPIADEYKQRDPLIADFIKMAEEL